MIELRKSNISGKGVFAAKDIKKGEIITTYPNHLPIRNGIMSVDAYYLERCMESVGDIDFISYYNSVDEKTKERILLDKLNSYSIGGNKVGNPWLYDDLNFVGHMINDGASIIPDNTDERTIKRYIISSMMNMNCILSSTTPIRALKDIKKGDEILTWYGFEYWLEVKNILIDDDTKERIRMYETNQFLSKIKVI